MASRKNKVGKSQVKGIDYDGINQKEVAEALGLSRTMVYHIEQTAMEKIRKELAKRNIKIEDLI